MEKDARNPRLVVGIAVALLTAGLLVYSQTVAFTWDEGFHLLAAQLILAGKRPYLDFCFPQTPLNAYWNALWMLMVGQSWRVAHALAALFTAGAVWLAADYVLRRLSVAGWRLPCALSVVVLAGLNAMLIQYGPIGQAYGISLFLATAGYRLAVITVGRRVGWLAFLAGLAAGASAACSLLSAAAPVVLIVWIAVKSRTWKRVGAFLGGAVIPFIPVFRLFVEGPKQTIYNVFVFQALYRRVKFEGLNAHDLDILSSWLDSSQALLLGALAIVGLIFVRRSGWDARLRSELYLSGWLALGVGLELSVAHPTFSRYYILVVPFLAILAAVGLYAVGSTLRMRPMSQVAVVGLFMALGLGRSFLDRGSVYTWGDMERLAAQVDQVTPRGATLWAPENVYFLTRRTPPSGMEFAYSHDLEMPPAEAALLHILPQSVLDREVAARVFSTVAVCDEDTVDDERLPKLYRHHVDLHGCDVFWGR